MSTGSGEIKDSLVVCRSNQGAEIRGSLLRLTRFAVVFEIYSPTIVLRLSEVLSEFRIVVQDRMLYSGRAVIGNLVNAGLTVVMMEVPCCRGLLALAEQASANAQRKVPLTAAIISIKDGAVLSEKLV